MKKVLLGIVMLMSVLSKAQTNTELKSVQVIGIKNNRLVPSTQIDRSCDSIEFLNQQKDPFSVFDKISPSIYSQSDNGQGTGYSYMRLRGLDQSRINFNLNGIPLNEMEDQGIYFSNMPGFYNYLSNITIQRGVGTSKYGNTSIAGSVNMETKDMTIKQQEFNILVRSNQKNNANFNGFYSSGLNKNGLAFQLGGSYSQNDGFKEHSQNDGGSIYYGIGLFKKNNIVKLYGFSGLTHNQLSFYGVPMDSLSLNYRKNLNSETDRDTFNQNFVSLNWINQKYDRVKFNTSTYFNNVNGRYNTAGILFGVNSYQVGAMTNMVYESNSYNLNIGLNVNTYQRKHFGSDNNGFYDIPSNSSRYDNTGYKNDFIAYTKLIKKINKVNLYADLQLRQVFFTVRDISTNEKYNWTFINPKIGLKTTGRNSDFHFLLGYTQREPTRSDMVQGVIQRDSLIFGNADNIKFLSQSAVLVPEKVSNIELGNKWFGNNYEINTNTYIMYIRNEFIPTGVIDPYSGFMIKQSSDNTLRAGLELDGKMKFHKFRIFGNTQFQHNQLNGDKNLKIPFVPNFIASGGISQEIRKVTIGLLGQHVSSMAMSTNTTQPMSNSYYVLNSYIDFKQNNVMVSLRVNNILDNKYYIPAGMGYNDINYTYHMVPTYYVGQLINWNLSVKYKL